MAALTRIALLALGVIAYRNREKLADIVSGRGRRQDGMAARQPAGAIADESYQPDIKPRQPRRVDPALEASTSLSGRADAPSIDAAGTAPASLFAAAERSDFLRDVPGDKDWLAPELKP